MTVLSAKIFAADDIAEELLVIPEWDVTVLVKSLTAKSRASMISEAIQNNGVFNFENVLPDMVILCTFDPESGERVFADTDRDSLMTKAAAPIESIAEVAMRLSGMTEDSVNTLGKESPSTTTEGSSSN